MIIMVPFTKQIFIGGCVTLILALLAYGGTWYVVLEYQETIRARLAERAAAAGRHLNLASLTKTANETKADREALAQYVVPHGDEVELLDLVERTAREEGIDVTTKSIALEPIPDSELFEFLAISMEVEGTFADITFVLSLLENLPYQVTIVNTSFNRAVEGRDDWRGTFDFLVTKAKRTS